MIKAGTAVIITNMNKRVSCISVIIVLLMMVFVSPASASELLHHDIDITIIPAEQKIRVVDTLSLRAGNGEWPGHFRLTPDAVIESVTVNRKKIGYRFTNGVLQIRERLKANDRMTVTYQTTGNDQVPANTVGIEDPSYGIRAAITPQGAFFSSGSAWLPLAEGRLATHDVRISAPEGLVGVTSGRFIASETDAGQTKTVWQNRVAQEHLALAVGYYQIHRDDFDDIQLLTFFTSQNNALAEGYLAACRDYLSFYQEHFGPYPYAKFAVVENFYPTGYGLPGWTLLGSTVIRLPFILTTSLPHEIAHAWWGNSVKVDYTSGNWAEGLATYVADYLLKERTSAKEARDYRFKMLSDYATLVDETNNFPLTDFRGRTSKPEQAVGYGKAAMVFHMLRQMIGDQHFWEGLRQVASRHANKRTSWENLKQVFSEVSGQNLDWFFQQWINTSGAPLLTLKDVRHVQTDHGWRVTGMIDQQTVNPYRFDIHLELLTQDASRVSKLSVSQKETRFQVDSPAAPVALRADPDYDLFRQLYLEELPVTTNSLRASRQRLVVLADGYDQEWLTASSDLLRGLQWHRAPVIKEDKLSPQQREERDLLIIGRPTEPGLLDCLPSDISIDKHEFSKEDKTFKNPGDALFITTGRTTDCQGVVGIFVPLSTTVANQVARKIPHYGRYSTLVFANGQNIIKETRDAENSPLRFDFEGL